VAFGCPRRNGSVEEADFVWLDTASVEGSLGQSVTCSTLAHRDLFLGLVYYYCVTDIVVQYYINV